ncbi:MAG: hypothetical protein IKC59_02355 [Clostridia bacterium]|nr:hypothetical protein [Clostridia bacterium]
MKRIVSTITVLSMLLTMILAATISPTAATQTSTSDVPIAAFYDNSLVTWWNFEGVTDADKLADKAQSGTPEKLSTSGTVTLNGETAVTAKGTTSYLRVVASSVKDLEDWNDKTIYLQYKLSDACSDNLNLLQSNDANGIRYFITSSIDSITGEATYKSNGCLGTWSSSSSTTFGYTTINNPQNASWCYLAISFDRTEDGIDVVLYNSVGGTTFTKTVKNFTGDSLPTLSVPDIQFVLANSGGKTTDIEIDDVRFYNAVLTEDVISTLPSYTPYSHEFTPADYDNNLVTWWDFEGGDKDSRLADKAKNGTAERLTTVGTVTLNGDSFSVTGNEKNNFVRVNYENTADIRDWENKTFFIQFKPIGETTDPNGYSSDLFNAPGSARCTIKSVTNGYSIGGGVGTSPTSTNYKFTNKTVTPTDEWCYLATTFTKTNLGYNVAIFYSTDGETFSSQVKSFTLDSTLDDLKLTADKTFNIADGLGRGVGFEVGDIRFYDTVLPASAIEALPSYTPYSASTVVAGLHDANLVAYYDFEGEDLEAQLADKAPVGLSKDTLKEGTEGTVSVNNGVATLNRVKDNDLQIPANSADTKDLNGKTVYLKFNTSGNVTGGSYDIIGSTDTYRVFMNGNANAHTFSGRNIFNPDALSNSGVPNADKFVSTGSKQVSKLADQWYYMALTFELTENSYVIKAYYSVNGTYYTESAYTAAEGNIPADLIRDSAIRIGNAGASTSEEGATFSIDELRIYNTVLTRAEIFDLAAETPLSDCLNYLGTQSKINENGTQDVRFLAHLNVTEDALNQYSEVGFVVSATYQGSTKPALTVSSDTVYSSVIAAGKTVTPANYGHINGYLLVLPVWNVPTDSEIVFSVQTYYKLSNSATPIYGEVIEITYNASSNA